MSELFDSYKARQRTGNGRRVLAWLAGSIVLHTALTASIIYVPALREAFQIAGAFGGMEYGEEDYELQNMGGERATMIRPGDMFQYPEGYFSQPTPPSTEPTAVTTPTPRATPKPTPEATPSPTPTPAPQPTPEATPSPAANAEQVAAAGGANANGDSNTNAEKPVDAAEAQAKIGGLPRVNSKPFTDFFKKTKESVDAGELDLSVAMRVSVEADRAPDGRLTGFRKWTIVPDSPQHQKLAREFVAIISASKAFLYLEGAKTVQISGTLNASTVTASVVSPTTSPDEASSKAKGYNLLLGLTRAARAGKNEAVFLQNTRVSAVGRNIRVDLSLPRSAAAAVIAKQLPAS